MCKRHVYFFGERMRRGISFRLLYSSLCSNWIIHQSPNLVRFYLYTYRENIIWIMKLANVQDILYASNLRILFSARGHQDAEEREQNKHRRMLLQQITYVNTEAKTFLISHKQTLLGRYKQTSVSATFLIILQVDDFERPGRLSPPPSRSTWCQTMDVFVDVKNTKGHAYKL